MSVDGPTAVESRLRLISVCVALALASAGCGYAYSANESQRDGGRGGQRDGPIRVDKTMSKRRVVPIANDAIGQRLPRKQITDVVCTSKVMYVFEGAVAQCTATINDDEASGWTLRFRDAAGTYVLDRMPGEPWQFATP